MIPVIEDYVVNEIVDNNRFQADLSIYHTNLEKFEEKSVFIAGTLVLACHDNRKASNLISNINPEDWKLMWKTLLIHYQPISFVNKV